jgi:cysteine-S-conjugate beta-lyase
VLCALDNTWGAGLAFNAFDLDGQGSGVDISIQALTKYPSGGGDVLMGSVVTRDAALHLKLKLTHMRMGLGVAANDAELVLRNLPSMALRYSAHDASARHLAHWLQGRAEVELVLHPALPDAPGHAHWQQLCGRAGPGQAAGLFSVVFKDRYSSAQVDAFCDALRVFKLGYSWGGHISLVVPYDISAMRDATVAHWPYRGILVRLNIGLEDVRDLQADLAQALAVLSD